MKSYTVQSGDTLSSIAGAIYNNAGLWQIIFDANRDILSNPNQIQVGQKLKIPPSKTKPSTTTTTTTSTGTLKLGSKGAPVKTLQKNLVALKYNLGVDGIFGPATDRSVRHVQRANGLSSDGLVGAQTQKLIANLLKGKPTKASKTSAARFSTDTKSNDTFALQRDLIALGFVIVLTGYFDEETLNALHQFQEAHGLEISDDLDSETLDALYEQTSVLEDDEEFDEDEDTDYYEDEDEDEEADDEDDGDGDEDDAEDEDAEDGDDEAEDEDAEDGDDEAEDEADGEDEAEDEADGDEAEDEADGDEAEDEADGDEAEEEGGDEAEDEGGGDEAEDEGGGDDGGGDDGGGDEGGGGDDGGGGGEDE